jgi:hypothetical protein
MPTEPDWKNADIVLAYHWYYVAESKGVAPFTMLL